MEDVEICRRLRQDGRIRIASTAIRTSARRWMRLGVIRTTLINQLLVAGFRLGISPQRLAGWYSAPSGGSFDRLRRVCSVRSLLAVGVLLFVIGFVDRQSQDSQSWSDVARNRDTLEQMMEQNRRAFPEADEVDMETILDMMRRETCVLVDVRTDAERRISIIPGAISAAEYEQNITEHSGRTVVCYCTIGYRSAHYAQQMKRQGVLVKSFNGSIIAWCQAGRILTTEDGRKTTRVHVYGSKWDLVPPEYQSVR
jgi:rhodanese-related sulfurtransferase